MRKCLINKANRKIVDIAVCTKWQMVSSLQYIIQQLEENHFLNWLPFSRGNIRQSEMDDRMFRLYIFFNVFCSIWRLLNQKCYLNCLTAHYKIQLVFSDRVVNNLEHQLFNSYGVWMNINLKRKEKHIHCWRDFSQYPPRRKTQPDLYTENYISKKVLLSDTHDKAGPMI